MSDQIRGYKRNFQLPKAQTEELTVVCNRCRSTWKESVTHFGVFAGYARNYDFCSKCITPEEKTGLGDETN